MGVWRELFRKGEELLLGGIGKRERNEKKTWQSQ
jgi:hypothetical protein